MAGLVGWLYNNLSYAIFGAVDMDYASARYTSDRYKPSVEDVVHVKEAMHSKSRLPYELIDAVVDMAEYWPHTTTILPRSVIVKGGRHFEENQLLLRSYPLGYFPSGRPNNQYLLGHERGGEPYTTVRSRPWPESQPAPNEATQELLSSWTSDSLPKGEHPCRKIVFTLESHDQGFGGSWSHKGTYEGSYTWFDVGLERTSATREEVVGYNLEMVPSPQFLMFANPAGATMDGEHSERVTCSLQTIIPTSPQEPGQEAGNDFHHPLLPSTMALQRNATATRDFKKYQITWSCDDNVVPDSLEAAALETQGRGRDSANGEFVRNLKVGDVVTIWAKARFPQWLNVVENVNMDVYWAV